VALHCDAFRQPFSVSLRRAEDWEMWIRLAKRGLSRVGARTSDGLSLHSTNMSLDVDAMIEAVATIEELYQISVD
jgi:hypothetical protein